LNKYGLSKFGGEGVGGGDKLAMKIRHWNNVSKVFEF
jgi:hypothetical protein